MYTKSFHTTKNKTKRQPKGLCVVQGDPRGGRCLDSSHLFLFTVLLVDDPVVLVVVLVAEILEQGLEQSSQVSVVWLVFELEGSAV